MRPEAFSEPFLELTQCSDDLIHPTMAGVLEGSASKGGKTGTKYYAGIQQISLGHDPFMKTGNRFIDHR
jgi:hypothetical protein